MNTDQKVYTSLTQKEKAISFLKLVASGNVHEAYQRYIGPNFFHHNPFFPGDREALMLAMEEDAANNPHKVLEVKIAIEEKEIVTIYSHVKQNPEDLGVAVVHIFRFQDEQIVELWDVGQSIPEDSLNENGMF
ncbi:polyketide cyclase [Paucisalibacillus sp. EB02]|uniref:nuclear transport factor 2 family protein n=1 Tax=Paucisalibacillus sp. EB02 TaxID=1347087 RepID=UPI0004ADF454|nr:polyketide cyclase [Paucisalibacillus sp. EB02]